VPAAELLELYFRDAGLLDRRPGYYSVKIVLTIAAFAAGWAALLVVGNSWATLGVAAFLGVMFTQLGFVGHDAGHQQVFRSRRATWLLGLAVGNALIGLSFGWWVPKHNAHHAHPNQVDRDPDIGEGLVVVTPTDGLAGERRSLTWFLARWQAWLFFPLMLLRSAGLLVDEVDRAPRRRPLCLVDREGVAEGDAVRDVARREHERGAAVERDDGDALVLAASGDREALALVDKVARIASDPPVVSERHDLVADPDRARGDRDVRPPDLAPSGTFGLAAPGELVGGRVVRGRPPAYRAHPRSCDRSDHG